ncbi:putative DBINO protein [Hordeum vulgare]|nr:putative DBINO protein [Hordeum vulgare]
MEEIAILDVEAAKRRGRRAKAKEMEMHVAYAVEADARYQARHLTDVDEKESIAAMVHVLLMLGLARPMPTFLSVAAMLGLENMISQKEVMNKRRSKGKEEQMKIYLEI